MRCIGIGRHDLGAVVFLVSSSSSLFSSSLKVAFGGRYLPTVSLEGKPQALVYLRLGRVEWFLY